MDPNDILGIESKVVSISSAEMYKKLKTEILNVREGYMILEKPEMTFPGKYVITYLHHPKSVTFELFDVMISI